MRYAALFCCALIATPAAGQDARAKARIAEIDAQLTKLRKQVAALEAEQAKLRWGSGQEESLRLGDMVVSVKAVKLLKAQRQMMVTFSVKNLHPNRRLGSPAELQNTVAYDRLGNVYPHRSGNSRVQVEPGEAGDFISTYDVPVAKAEEVAIQLGSIGPGQSPFRLIVLRKQFAEK